MFVLFKEAMAEVRRVSMISWGELESGKTKELRTLRKFKIRRQKEEFKSLKKLEL